MIGTQKISRIGLLIAVTVATVSISFPSTAQAQKSDIRKRQIPWEGRTIYVRDLVGWGFKKFILPKSFNKFGVTIRRDEVKVKRVETDFRGGFWITVKAKYKGGFEGLGEVASEDVTIYFDAGHVRVDIGSSLKGVINTRSVANKLGDFLPKYLQPRLGVPPSPPNQIEPPSHDPTPPQGMTGSQYQQEFNRRLSSGLMPGRVRVESNRGQLIYNVTWQPRSNRPFVARHGINEQQFQSINANLQQQGFRLAGQSSATLNGQRYYIAYWVK